MRRVLTDFMGVTKMQIVEGETDGVLIVEGKIGHCDNPTANGRVYPRKIMEREIKRLKPRIEQASVMSAVDHPGDGKTRIKESGALVRDLWIEDSGEVRGRFEVVEDATCGKDLAAFLRRGAQIGMSSRGMGSTVPGPDGSDVVGEDYRLSTWDFVSDPACHDAYPALISEDEEEQVTEDYLRARFPKIVHAIEEKSYQTAQEVVEEDVRTRLQEDVEKDTQEALSVGRNRIREEMKADIYEEAYQSLREDFAVRLVRTIADLRNDITEEVRSDLASDPEVAGAKSTLKKVSEMVSPYQAPHDVKRTLNETGALKEKVKGLRDLVQTEQERSESLQETGRQLAFKLYIEQQVGGRSDAALLRDMVGDIAVIETVDDLRKRVAAVLEKAGEIDTRTEQDVETVVSDAVAQSQAESKQKIDVVIRKAERAQERYESAKEANADLQETVRSQVAAVEEQVKAVIAEKTTVIEDKNREIKAIQSAADDRFALMTYAARRTVGHHKAHNIMEAVARGKLMSENDVDKVATHLEESAEGPGGVNERVRRAMSSGREHMTEDESRVADAAEQDAMGEFGEAADDLREIGTSLTEQMNLAGMNRNRR